MKKVAVGLKTLVHGQDARATVRTGRDLKSW